jgi:hypothetical protein
MSRTTVSSKPCLHEPRPGESRGWDDDGLVEAALEGRLGPHARLVDTSRPAAFQNSELRSRLVRALGFLAIVVGTLVLAGVLKS